MIYKLARFLFNLIFSDKVFDLYIKVKKKSFEPRIQKAEERYLLNIIKRKGIDSRISWGSTIHQPENLVLGDHVRIGSGAFLFCLGGISIGDNTIISRNILIYSANHDINGNAIPYDNHYVGKEVIIGKSVWIGMNVIIRPGIKIGDGAVIGMGTVISSDVPEGAIVVGPKQRTIKHRDMSAFHEKEKKGLLFAKLWPDF